MRRALRSVVTVATVVLVATGCGDDPVTRDEFIAQLQAITSGPDEATPEVAGCIYDEIASDRRLLEAASSGSDLPRADEERLEAITAECWTRAREEAEDGDSEGGDRDRRDDRDRPTTTRDR